MKFNNFKFLTLVKKVQTSKGSHNIVSLPMPTPPSKKRKRKSSPSGILLYFACCLNSSNLYEYD